MSDLLISPSSVYLSVNVTFTCVINDLGNPVAKQYKFYKNNTLIITIISPSWNVTIGDRSQGGMYSCSALSIHGNTRLESDRSKQQRLKVKG